ncbi:hypothetical protein BQ8420_28160 [Nocardiopsis sp. JB363]|nr:hypothetical protein BQ8420_28160 [Nocardiopsis sp. JB363]
MIPRAFHSPSTCGQVDMATRWFMEVTMDEFRQVVTDDLGR